MDDHILLVPWLLMTLSVPVFGFDIYDKVTTMCPLQSLKRELDSCTGDEQPVYIFLPPSLTSMSTSVGERTYVSPTGIDYQQAFLQVDSFKCQREQRVKRERQLDCRYEKMMSCVPRQYQFFLPLKTRIREGMQYLCQHILDIRQDCEIGRLSQLNMCVKDKDQGSYTEDEEFTQEDRMCRTYRYARECLQTSLSQCAEAEVDVYLKTLDYLAPEICGASSHTASFSTILIISGLVLFLKKDWIQN